MQLTNKQLLRDHAYINGEWVDGDGKISVSDPATGKVIMEIPDLGETEVENAIDSAYEAFPAWSSRIAKDRADLLLEWFDLIMKNQEDLAQLMTAEQGKPLAESRGEVSYGASFVRWYAEESRRMYGEVTPSYADDRKVITVRQPVGVMASVTPWNFPIAMITRKVAPALAAGCTAVVKPSEETPLCALALAVLAEEAGIPAGVFNVVTTLDAAMFGDRITASKKVRKISFTGSTKVGKLLMKKSSDTVKKISLELGGNAPFIVFDDADLEAAVEGAIQSKYRNSGQTCVCANRILVQDSIYESFVNLLARRVGELKVGVGTEKDVSIGPLISEKAIEKVERIVADAKKKGGKVFAGGNRVSGEGQFYVPTILTDVNETMACHREEIFGPVAPVFRFEDENDVIRMANNTDAGLAAYFYSRDVGRIWRVAEALEYGMVGINTGLISTEVAPFGGIKESGIGREGSRHGMDEFTELKYLCMAY